MQRSLAVVIVLVLFTFYFFSTTIILGQNVELEPVVTIRLFDAETGEILNGPIDVTYQKGGQTLTGQELGDTLRIRNEGRSPIESLRVHRAPFQPISVRQLDGGRSDLLNLVAWPQNGPKTLDRVFEMLHTYERIYYDYGLDYSAEGRATWEAIRTRYSPAISGMPHPSTLPTSNQMKLEWTIHKYNDIVHVYRPNLNEHCPCDRAFCCWCGRKKR